ncbi:MAG: sugar phosphate isomerase/epimerase [Firmicutes bacterium]|nr:sugar phosphate isomerase/epimerase [Bacillota bacterium]
MKIATTTGDFSAYTESNLEAIEYVKKSGFRYIDYSFCLDYNNKTGFFGNDADYIKKLHKKIGELDVMLIQSHAPFSSLMFEKDISGLICDTIKCVRACAELDIPTLVVHTGYAHSLSKEETLKKNKEFFMPILEEAAQCKVKILAENFNKMEYEDIYWIDNATDLKEFIEYVNHTSLYAVWDAGHANLQEMNQYDELKIIGSYLQALHIHDNLGEGDNHMAPFFGTMSIDSLMQGLIDIGYSGYFTFEAENILLPFKNRRICTDDTRLLKAPLELRLKAEAFLYEIGKTILKAYDCFEE